MPVTGEDVLKYATYFFVIIGIIALVCVVSYGIYHYGYNSAVQNSEQTTFGIPTHQTVLTFTALTTTTSNGYFQVITTGGDNLVFATYTEWNRIFPQSIYTCAIDTTDSNGRKYVSNCMLEHQYIHRTINTFPKYYAWNGNYYQCDMNTCDTITWKQIAGENIIRARPPYYGHMREW